MVTILQDTVNLTGASFKIAGTAFTGIGSNFVNELSTVSKIRIGSVDHEVGAIGSATALTLDASGVNGTYYDCLLYTSPSPRDRTRSRMPSSA